MEKIKGKIKYDYDPESDVLYSYINKPQAAKSISKKNGIVIRIEPSTNKIVGFTIIDFKKRIRDGILKKIPFFENINVRNISINNK